MSVKLSEMISADQRQIFGLTIQRINIDIGPFGGENTYTFTLIKEPGQTFQLQDVTFRDGVAPFINLTFAELDVFASVISWKETIADIGGNSIYTVVLAQYNRVFLQHFQFQEINHLIIFDPITHKNVLNEDLVAQGAIVDEEGILQEVFLWDDIVYIPEKMILPPSVFMQNQPAVIFGPPITKIFDAFKDKIFNIGGVSLLFNFDGLLIDNGVEQPIHIRLFREYNRITLFTVIEDYAVDNNFEYSSRVKRINEGENTGIYEVSFYKHIVPDGINGFATENDSVLNVLAAMHNGEIINHERGYAVAKDFTTRTSFSVKERDFIPPGYVVVPVDPENLVDKVFVTKGITEFIDFTSKKIVHIVRGGLQSNFLNFTAGDIHQFWGFKSPGVLKDPPSTSDLSKMNKILNNEDIIDDDGYLREFMNLWGRQFVVDGTRLIEFLPLTPEQEVAIAEEEQAIIDLIEALLAHFNSLPRRKLGDHYRNGEEIFRGFLLQYKNDHPEIFDNKPTNIYDGLKDFLTAASNGPNNTVFLDPDSVVGKFNTALNSLGPSYPSIDDILMQIGEAEFYQFQGYVGLSLISTQISLEQERILRQIPASIRAKGMCFPSVDHPLSRISKAIANFRSSIGQWPSYIKLPKLPPNKGDTEHEWGSKIISTINHAGTTKIDPKTKFKIKSNYVRVDVKQYNNFYIITLPGQMLQIQTVTSKTTDNPDGDQKRELKIIEHLNDAFIATEDTQKRYGPFVVSEGRTLDENNKEYSDIINNPSEYVIKNIVNDRLVPENFNPDGKLSYLESIEEMKKFITQNLSAIDVPKVQSNQFGSITVAGLPVEQAFLPILYAGFSRIARININFDINGIKTTYYTEIPQREDIQNDVEISDRLEPLEEKLDKIIAKKPKNEVVDINEPKLESDPKQNTLSDKELEYIYKKPEGGQGVIEDVEPRGPFYTVRRVNYADIDPQTFAGGLNITGSYFAAEWKHVRNLAESTKSPGYLLPGTIVNVSIFSDSEFGPFLPYIEQSPQVFMPPLDDQEEEK